jgi:hypothetical protein
MWQLDGPIELLECDEQVDVVRQGRLSPADVQYIDGIPTATHPPIRHTVTATLQPMGGRDLMLVPEGFRDKQTLWLWQAHRTAAQDTFRIDVADLVLYGPRGYQVQTSEDWGSYTRCMLVAVDLGTYQSVIDASITPDVYVSSLLAQDPIQVGAIPLGDQMANYLYNANGLPADNLGNIGDLYLDMDTYICYGPKTADGWPSTGKDLHGPPGERGPPGEQGVPGERGPEGSIIYRDYGPPSDDVLAEARPEDYYLDLETGYLYPFYLPDDPAAATA